MEKARAKRLHREIEHVESPKDFGLNPLHRHILEECVGRLRRKNWYKAIKPSEREACREMQRLGLVQPLAITTIAGEWWSITEAGCVAIGLSNSDKRNVLAKGNLKAKGDEK